MTVQRLLFISPILAMPSQHGGCVYPYALLDSLHASGVAVDYGWLGAPLQGGRRLMRNPLTANYINHGWVRGSRRTGSFLLPGTAAGWLGRKPKPSEERRAEQEFVARLIRKTRPQAVLVDTTEALPVLDALTVEERDRLSVGVLTHNLNHRRTTLYRQYAEPLDFEPMTESEEIALLRRADIIVAIQEREAQAFRGMVPDKTVVTVPIPLVATPLPASLESTRHCVFIGGYSGHNLDGMRWLLGQVWPRVQAAQPDAVLDVVGTVGQALAAPPPGVRVLGPVPDLRAAYSQAQLALVPLRMGTGLKIKLVEAMAYGRAVVTTSCGAEGFAQVEAGDVAVVRDEPSAYAESIARLLANPLERSQVVRRQLVWLQARLAPDTALAPLLAAWTAALPGLKKWLR